MSLFNSHFDGEYRRKPVVSIRGASKKESREDLLHRTALERQNREALRVKGANALRIQSYLRGYLTRKREKNRIRREFLAAKSKSDLGVSLTQFNFFFESRKDEKNLEWICKACLKKENEILGALSQNINSRWFIKILGLLRIILRYLKSEDGEETVSLKVLRAFTAPGKGILIRLFATVDYFEPLRRLLEKKEGSINPDILVLVRRPIFLVESGIDKDYNELVLRSLSLTFFYPPFSEAVYDNLFLALKAPEFPFKEWVLVVKNWESPSPWLLYSFLTLENTNHATSTVEELYYYLEALSQLTASLNEAFPLKEEIDYDEEEEGNDYESRGRVLPMDASNCDSSYISLHNIFESIEERLNDRHWTSALIDAVFEKSEKDSSILKPLCGFLHRIMLMDGFVLHNYRLMYMLAFKPTFLHRLWNVILNCKQPTLFGMPSSLISVISKGMYMSHCERDEFVPLLAVFTSLFSFLLVTINDTEFYGNDRFWMPFKLSELVPMSLSLRDIAIGLTELAFPESRLTVRKEYELAMRSVRPTEDSSVECDSGERVLMWSHLFKMTVKLVRQLHTRDTRRQFCEDNHWINDRVSLSLERPSDFSLRGSQHYRPFRSLRVFSREELEQYGPPLSVKEMRLATVLRELPYVISFNQRILLFSQLVSRDKNDHQSERVNFLLGPSINVVIRRNFIYEDAFEKLSPENEPNLRLKMRVQFMNVAGLSEAGIDGGGLFREFLGELIKTSFDPNRGFFRLTRDQRLYPNPSVHKIIEDYIPHYFFIGRMLGKALYENMLVEFPLAGFFLLKLLGKSSVKVDIDHLQSFDPELYKNLLYLKNYNGNVQDLGLDFTIVNEEVGTTSVEELKRNGSSIPVTNSNRTEYIHLMADYKLNRQIRTQCNSFRQGLSDVIDLDWLKMFSYKELQLLISGAETEIDVSDLKQHTNYSGGYSCDHPTVMIFWIVVESMTEEQKRHLLKFVTSCSRPPLLGFKELDPPFNLQNAGSENNRLPTASTCMNLLKLPDFQEENMLREKLLYAIESGSGFDLS